MPTATHFYLEGIRFYTDPVQQKMRSFYVHSQTSGIVNPREYLGAIYTRAVNGNNRCAFLSWAKPGSLSLDFRRLDYVSDSEMQNLECFEVWSRAVADYIRTSAGTVSQAKNPIRKLYFDSGLAQGSQRVSYVLTKRTFQGYDHRERQMWKDLVTFFMGKGASVFYLADDGFTGRYADLAKWTLISEDGDGRPTGMVICSERDEELKKIMSGTSISGAMAVARNIEELKCLLKDPVKQTLKKCGDALLLYLLGENIALWKVVGYLIGTIIVELAQKGQGMRQSVRDALDNALRIAEEVRRDAAVRITNWDELEDKADV